MKKRLNLDLDERMFNQFKQTAADQGHTMSFLVKRWITKYLERMTSALGRRKEEEPDDTSET